VVSTEKEYLERIDQMAELQETIKQKYVKQLTKKAVDTGCHQILRELVKYELKSISIPRQLRNISMNKIGDKKGL